MSASELATLVFLPNPSVDSSGSAEFHARAPEEVLSELSVGRRGGLTPEEAERRLEEHGPNSLRESRRRPVLGILLDQFESLVIAILGAAALIAFVFGQNVEGLAILAVLLVNTVIGFVSEWRAMRSVESLKEMRQPKARVRRRGEEMELDVERVVPGDVVILKGGDVVPADVRVLEAEGLRVNEAALTGESVAALKGSESVEEDRPLAERTSMLFKGTTVVEGEAEGAVVATGMLTELGKISEMTERTEAEATPLERRLDRLAGRLAWLALGAAGAIAALGLATGKPTLVMVETALALGVAAVPEGVPIVTTIALAKGMWLMAGRNALIKHLSAVETLGATRVVFTDKTGTLTENRMELARVLTSEEEIELDGGASDGGEPGDLLRRALEIGVLCSNAALESDEDSGPKGDPTEVALLRAGARFGLTRQSLLEEKPEVHEVSFDPETMMMATYHESENGVEVAVKGAPERVLEACRELATEKGDRELSEEERDAWIERSRERAEEGFRMMALADKRAGSEDEEPYERLRLVGLAALVDPLRAGAREAIEACREAGIRVVMVTGDKPETARAIARELGILRKDEEGSGSVVSGEALDDSAPALTEARVFARVRPEQKLDLIEAFQNDGGAIAMTGDGVNDAPALKRADIGVAMGRRGTEAARQVADMVLQDDALASIVAAVRQGRITFDNIRKSMIFMLCTNVAEVMAVGAAAIADLPLPLTALQILFLNVITDVFPAIALSVGPGETDVMERRPRSSEESILTAAHWRRIAGLGGIVAISVLGALAAGLSWLDLPDRGAVTLSFLTLAFAKLWFVFNLRSPDSSLFDNDVVRNAWIWGALVLCAGLLLAAVYLPVLSAVLATVPPGTHGWAAVFALSAVPFASGQALLAQRRSRSAG